MEKLSALMDGELDERELAHELSRINEDLDREAGWAIYHMIGDSLRGEDIASDRVTAQVSARLATEPTVLAPRAWRVPGATRRVALPIAASLCGAAVVAWLALSNNALLPPADEPGQDIVLTTSPGNNIAENDQAGSDAMREYLMAHQQFSPSTAMQGVASYVRTVSAADASR
jgi:sigma-E factor negative regulatory protein RseA